MRLVLGARQSDLARLQGYLVGDALKSLGVDIEYVFRESLGDKNLTDPLWKMPEKGVFTQDFYQDLINGKLDFVVHSWKDLPVEHTQGTEIVATLPRADQRDLVLIKKSSLKKKTLRIFSSSPRREYNLIPFLSKHLPWTTEKIEFANVRGNIPTRLQKMTDDESIDGLVLAKAAIDRLLAHPYDEFKPVQEKIRGHLAKCNWIVPPISENPNAAAQGALAIEIRSDRKDLKELFAKIHCEKTASSVVHERKVFSGYGGGCHQKIGVAVLNRSYGEILTVKGLSPKGEILDTRKLLPTKSAPADLVKHSFNFSIIRNQKPADVSLANTDMVWVARSEAAGSVDLSSYQGVVWAAGTSTWEKLAKKGVWVNGCAEGLGESEDPRIEWLIGKTKPELVTLTHTLASNAGTYDLQIQLADGEIGKLKSDLLASGKYFFYWKSHSQFQAVLAALETSQKQNFLNCAHACGPGKTWQNLKDTLGTDQNLYIYLNEESWKS